MKTQTRIETDASFGYNFELANVFTLNQTTYISLGTEGGREIHDSHWPLWASGRIVNGTFAMESAGVMDFGTYYAANSMQDGDRRIVFAWSNDEDETQRAQMGFGGVLTLPREAFEWKKKVHPSQCPPPPSFKDIGNCTLVTLGVRPISELNALAGPPVDRLQGLSFEVRATQSISEPVGKYSIILENDKENYPILIDLSQERVSIQRGTFTEQGPFSLLRLEQGYEDLSIRVFVDVSIVEVFINDRFALTTRIYPSGPLNVKTVGLNATLLPYNKPTNKV